MSVSEGRKAPNFSLTDKDGKAHSLAKGSLTVLYFYPKDDTPGCTIEAKEFSEELAKFAKKKARVFGVSGGDARSKEKFCTKHDLSVTLLSDADFKVAKAYGAFGEKTFMGRKFNGIFRKTFLIDGNQTVVRVFDAVTPKGHAEEVLKAIEELSGKKLSEKKGGKKAAAAVRPAAKKAKAAAKRPAVKGKAKRK